MNYKSITCALLSIIGISCNFSQKKEELPQKLTIDFILNNNKYQLNISTYHAKETRANHYAFASTEYKGYSIQLITPQNDSIFVEGVGNLDKVPTESELQKILLQTHLKISDNNAHIAYWRNKIDYIDNINEDNQYIKIIHFIENNYFQSPSYLKKIKNIDIADLNLNTLPSPTDIILEMLEFGDNYYGNQDLYDKMWKIISVIKANEKIDMKLLSYWPECPDRFSIYPQIIHEKAKPNSGVNQEWRNLLNKKVEELANQLDLNSSFANVIEVMMIAGYTNNETIENKIFNLLIPNWHQGNGVVLYRFYDRMSNEQQKYFLDEAKKLIISCKGEPPYSIEVRQALENYLPCEELKELNIKLTQKLAIRKDCEK